MGRRERIADYESIGKSRFTVPISIILPAFNEETTVLDSVEALRKLDHPEAEIIVVNDGSTDGTLDTLIRAFKLFPASKIIRKEPGGGIQLRSAIRGFYISPTAEGVRRVMVVDKENGGKADALNAGVLVSRFPICCTVDADSLLEFDSLLRSSRPFLDEPDETLAVGGLVRVVNGCTVDRARVVGIRLPRRLLPLAQIVEYFRSFLGVRYGLASLRSLLILSGAFAMFRRSAIVEVGGFRPEVITEDMEITCAIHRRMKEAGRPYKVSYIPDPISWTEVPEHLVDLLRQRTRWHRGLLQVLALHSRVSFNPRYGVVGLFAFPYHLLFEAWGPVVEALGYVVVPIGWFLGLIDFDIFALFLASSFLFGLTLSLFSLFLQTRSRMPYDRGIPLLGLAALMESGLLRPVIAIFRAWATFQHLLGRSASWGRQTRKGF